MYVVFCKIDHCIHIHWYIVMGLGHNDPWVESHMWPQQTWGQRSSRGQWPLVQVFGKKGQCIHILWCIFKSNITMIAKVCDRESRQDTWFENRLVISIFLRNRSLSDARWFYGKKCKIGKRNLYVTENQKKGLLNRFFVLITRILEAKIWPQSEELESENAKFFKKMELTQGEESDLPEWRRNLKKGGSLKLIILHVWVLSPRS